MNPFKPSVKKLIEQLDFKGLTQALSDKPKLANEGVTIPFDLLCRIKAHPLHRICDPVFNGKIGDDDAVKLAKIFLAHGANVDGDKVNKEGTPLLAAASLRAEQVGILYIDEGADTQYTYKDDGVTPLHWAAFCGLDKLVERLIKTQALINEPDKNHGGVPLSWALHALESSEVNAKHRQVKCIKLLLNAGALLAPLSKAKVDFLMALAQEDDELRVLIEEQSV